MFAPALAEVTAVEEAEGVGDCPNAGRTSAIEQRQVKIAVFIVCFGNEMRPGAGLDSKKDAFFASFRSDKNLASGGWLAIIPSLSKCGCSSVVEHLLAKEDVASSSLVTRSPGKAVDAYAEHQSIAR